MKKPSLSVLSNASREARKQAEASERGAAMADAFAKGAEDRIEAATARKKPKEIPAWQEGKRVITAWIELDQFKLLNQVHVDHKRSVRVLVEEAIDDLLVKYNAVDPLLLKRRRSEDN